MIKSNTSVLIHKNDVYRAAWRLKRAVYKNRMRCLKEEALSAASKPTFLQRLCGIKINEPTAQDVLNKMQQLWDDKEARFMGLTYWHIGGWKYLADALRLIAASNAPGKKYLRLSSEDARTLQEYWDTNTIATITAVDGTAPIVSIKSQK